MIKNTILRLLLATLPLNAAAQQNSTYQTYIDTYKTMAIDQMKRHQIPASITLAQGLLESAAGRSYLATAANNHFGIKVGGAWTGPWVAKDDDRAQEKFRKYTSAADSYEDHSLFLHKPRYSALFTLAPTDYRGWAHGLKAAGYATNPQYADLLINIIETYHLAQYDILAPQPYGCPIADATPAVTSHVPRLCNDVAYVVAREGDTYESLAAEFGLKAQRLRRYNQVPKGNVIAAGEVVYLKSKKSHVARRLRGTHHVVEPGESMHSISQRYAIKLEKLYRWNALPYSYQATAREKLLLK